MKIDDYILLLFGKDGIYPCKIPSVRFWALTLLFVGIGLEIEMKDGHILTVKDCFIEMDDCANGDCYKIREKGDKK